MKKKTVALLCVALLLSIASTLAFAWACAAWLSIDQDIPGRFTSVEVRDELWETFYVQRRFGHTRTNFIRGLDHYDASTELFISSNSPHDEIWQETSAGWPWRALRCERETFAVIVPDRFGYIRNTSPQIRNGIAAFGGALTWRDLPYEPVWPALIGNVLVHSAAWYALIIGLPALRKVNRTRRGLCPQCAYDLRRDLSRGCPECGWHRKEEDAQQPA